jgi:hypothetical protein
MKGGIMANYKVGIENKSYKHGLCDHVLYDRWRTIKKKCYRPNATNYQWYGAKGVGMYEAWINDFKAFYDFCIDNGWKQGLEIARHGDTGNYEPGNIKFVTPEENHEELLQRQRKQIRNVESDIVFDSLQDAAKWVLDNGLSKGIIKTVVFNIKRVSRKGGTAYGYHWELK